MPCPLVRWLGGWVVWHVVCFFWLVWFLSPTGEREMGMTLVIDFLEVPIWGMVLGGLLCEGPKSEGASGVDGLLCF